MSRLWGYVNSLELPIWFRPYGLGFYAYAFGCNLDEIEPSDLRKYPSLGAFFYRKLKDGVRPIDTASLVCTKPYQFMPNNLRFRILQVSPADGTVLHFGTVQESRVEQVKGITYSLDALLGIERPNSPTTIIEHNRDMSIVDDQEFANVNGIEYSLEQLIGASSPGSQTPSDSSSSLTSTTLNTSISPTPHANDEDIPKKFGDRIDASVGSNRNAEDTLVHHATVALEMGIRPSTRRLTASGRQLRPGNKLFFSVIYLAPGDYHRFHSPTAWVVEKRRHFVGSFCAIPSLLFASYFFAHRGIVLGITLHGKTVGESFCSE